MKKIGIILIIAFGLILTLSACDDFIYSPQESDSNAGLFNDISEGSDSDDSPKEEEEEEETLFVQALVNVNVRLTPDSSGNNIVGTLKAGEKTEYIERANQNWYYIIYKGKKAYVSANSAYTMLLDGAQSAPEGREQKIESIIAAGMAKLAVPYQYGATRVLLYSGAPNPAFTGKTFDCSSFVQYAFYAGAGVKLQGDSRSQSLHGQSVAREALQRGDLIFMTTPARATISGIEHIGHVAIYLGEGKILHTHGAGGVKVDTLSGVWSSRYVSARRMF
ncbi:MAG: C40 family peptidase [Christensenellales bacterium]|jgi:cell wall-associated NlpC family hydrolase